MSLLSLQVEKLKAGYVADIPILNEISLGVQEGRITLVIGPNGSGKSTLLKAIFGAVPWKSGTVTYSGESITNKKPREILNRGIAYIPQDGSLFPRLTVKENLLIAGKVAGLDEKTIMDRVAALPEEFSSVVRKADAQAGDASGGEQKLIAIARAMVLNTKLLLLDEPTAALAPKLAGAYLDKLTKLKESGVTILIVEQNVREALKIADYVYVMQTGLVADRGERKEIESRLDSIVRSWLA